MNLRWGKESGKMIVTSNCTVKLYACLFMQHCTAPNSKLNTYKPILPIKLYLLITV